MSQSPEAVEAFKRFLNDWNLFARDYLRVKLDNEQQEALHAIQHNSKVAISSGTSRGKDYLMATAAICFMYLTIRFDKSGKLVDNSRVILTAPSARQVNEIMMPEISRIFKNSYRLPGELRSNGIITPYDEWSLIAFKADEAKTESWTGFHAVNIFIGVTEATGLPQKVFDAIEGNLQSNSRLVLCFNPNVNHGYAANAMRSPLFKKLRLNSLNAPNVIEKRIVFPGQVNYEWVKERVDEWCMMIRPEEKSVTEGDFEFEGGVYRPNDLFRAKILGLFPKVSEGSLIPHEWIDLANARWKQFKLDGLQIDKPLRLGSDVAGMGRDSSANCHRYGDLVEKFDLLQSKGTANHMEVAGNILSILQKNTNAFSGKTAQTFIDTIGEGAGVYSRLLELTTETAGFGKPDYGFLKGRVHSCKFSEAATKGDVPLTDHTGQYKFLNMRAYVFWALRDWLDPDKGSKAMLPRDEMLAQELTEIQWKFRSDGKIQIEDKEELKKRLKRSPDKSDALANTFYPVPDTDLRPKKPTNNSKYFF
jgi:hypothetical protein